MKQSPWLFALLTALLLTTGACTSNQTETDQAKPAPASETPAAPTASNDPNGLPGFQLKGLDGSSLQLSSLRGKKVFVNLWASWCPPCRAEMPSIEALYAKADTAKTAFVMISVDEEREAGANFALNKKLAAPVFFPEQPLPKLFQVQGIPATFIFDEQGKLIKRIDGASDYDTPEYVKLLNN